MEVNVPHIVDELTKAFERYEKALVENDVYALDDLFWSSDEVVRYGATENLYGHDQILAFRKQRPSAGLERVLSNTVITTFGTDFGTANTEFSRAHDSRIGRQSHCWARFPEGWKIVAAHVSWMDGQ